MRILICVGAVLLSNICSPVKSASKGAAWLQIFCCPALQVEYLFSLYGTENLTFTTSPCILCLGMYCFTAYQ